MNRIEQENNTRKKNGLEKQKRTYQDRIEYNEIEQNRGDSPQ